MRLSVEFSDQCEADLAEIVTYLVRNAPKTAVRFGEGFDLLIARLREFPYSAPVLRGSLRRAVVPGVEYVAIYEVLPDRIKLHAVANGRQMPGAGS